MIKKAKKSEITLKQLLEAGVHFGHQSRRWNPKMKPYLFDIRDGVHVIDLVKTKEGLEQACQFVGQLTTEGGIIVFVGTKRQAQAIVAEEAKKAGFPYVTQRWMGGLITNWEQIKKSIDKLIEMTKKKEQGEYKKYTKKEQLLLDREIVRLRRFFGGLVALKEPPQAIFLVDVKKEQAAVKEANRKGIKVVALVDSNSDPTGVDFVIPGNDDAVGSIKIIVSTIAQAAREGKQIWEKKKTKGAK